MFVVSVSGKKIKGIILIIIAVLLLSAIFVFLLKSAGTAQLKTSKESDIFSVSDEDDVLSFVSGCGWDVDRNPVEVREVFIPEIFDDVYTEYNKIQLSQGFDLLKYAGRRVKRWTYIIKNYPSTDTHEDHIRINVLVCDGMIIGGDVCSVKLDGFMHGFYKE